MVDPDDQCQATAPLRGVPEHMETHHCDMARDAPHDWHRCACGHTWEADL